MPDYRQYSSAELDAIRARYLAEGAHQLAAELGRSAAAIRHKAQSIGLRRAPGSASRLRRKWTPEEDGMIRAEWPLIQRKIKPAAQLAKRMGVGINILRRRAAALGVRATFKRQPAWADAELDILDQYRHLMPEAIAKKLEKAGFTRTPLAIGIKRCKDGYLVCESTDAYSANALARLMGVSDHLVCKWIQRGLLRASPVSDAVRAHNQATSRWIILPQDVRSFIAKHVAHIDISTADKYWLVDLLMGDNKGNAIPVLRQNSAGYADNGFQEIAEIGS